jgi:hypothetical protein
MSLVKFSNRTQHNGQRIHWGRSGEDGLPFRGQQAPMYTQEEWEEKTVKVADPHNGHFDTSDPEQNKKYLEVLDGITNGWFQCIYIKRQYDPEQKMVYVEWVEYFLEDGNRAPFMTAGQMELLNGQPNLPVGPQ